MQAYPLNQLPHRLLADLDAEQAVLRTSGDTPEVLGSTSFDPRALQPLPRAALLRERLEEQGLHSLTLCLFRLNHQLIERATEHFGHREALTATLPISMPTPAADITPPAEASEANDRMSGIIRTLVNAITKLTPA